MHCESTEKKLDKWGVFLAGKVFSFNAKRLRRGLWHNIIERRLS
jgi:hypothetical protein